MVTSRIVPCLCIQFLLLITIDIITTQALDEIPFRFSICFVGTGNFTDNSTYGTNLNSLLRSLPSNGNGYGFYSSYQGENPDKVYAMGLCRGDINADACVSCLNNATHDLRNSPCRNQKQAYGWYHNCMLRYSNTSINGFMEDSPVAYSSSGPNVSSPDADGFNKELKTLLENLTREAAAGGSLRKFAVGNTSSPANSTDQIYGLAQCTPDLSEADCNNCLKSALAYIPACCTSEKKGGRVVTLSCDLQYEMYLFFDPSAVAPLPNTTIPGGKKKNTSRTVIIIVVAVVISLLLMTISICIYLRLKKKKETLLDDEIRSAEALQFDFGSIRVATNNFSEANKLGRGGFGAVYRGVLFTGQDIAVKRLSTDSAQGDVEFKNEVVLVAKLQHRNLVRLLGFCLDGNERLLVYEYVHNASLDHFIFDSIKRAHLNWDNRINIIIGIGRGLLYLHEDSRLKIIHRDLKASNILLDEEMNPKIADFGMARLFLLDQTQGETSRIVGTYGYMAPEYMMRGQFSVKSDVYSFGIIVLEIVSGQKTISRHGDNAEDLLSYAWKNWREGTTSNLIDPSLRVDSTSEIMRCIQIGLLCVQQNIGDRPTMASVIQMLTGNSLMTLPLPSHPAFFMVRSDMPGVFGSNRSRSNSVQYSANEASITELSPR